MLIVIFLFLGTLRATLIPAVTIPVSIVAAAIVMLTLDYSINTLTLLAAVLAIGLVVDDAIVVLENIVRRIDGGEPAVLAAINGSKEIGFAVIATTLVLMAVFIPVSFMQRTTQDVCSANSVSQSAAGGLGLAHSSRSMPHAIDGVAKLFAERHAPVAYGRRRRSCVPQSR